jgi:aldose 1-epimerase
MAANTDDYGFTFLPQGAIIQEFRVAGHNIVQSFSTAEQYRDAAFFGETIGRTTNRIKDGIIGNLNGRTLQLAQNDSGNHLHGGLEGWGKKIFAGPCSVNTDGKESVFFTYTSPDGEEGFPGTVDVNIWYTGYDMEEDGVKKIVLEVEYEVDFTGDECEETTVGVTNHR